MPTEDQARKQLIEARNNADNAVYTAEKALRDLGEKVPADVRSNVEAEVAKVRGVMNSEDSEGIRKATEDLYRVVQQIGAAAYQQSGPAAGAPGSSPDDQGDQGDQGNKGGPGDEDVVEGEFHNA